MGGFIEARPYFKVAEEEGFTEGNSSTQKATADTADTAKETKVLGNNWFRIGIIIPSGGASLPVLSPSKGRARENEKLLNCSKKVSQSYF